MAPVTLPGIFPRTPLSDGIAGSLVSADKLSRQFAPKHDCGSTDASPVLGHHHPSSFYCPISQQCMRDPVVLSDGHSYERQHIEQWLQHHRISPVSGLWLRQRAFLPNHALRNAIEEYFHQVSGEHRRALRWVLDLPEDGKDPASNMKFVRIVDAFLQCLLLTYADVSAETALVRIMEEARALLHAEVALVFLIDAARQELFSAVNPTGWEIRAPLEVGILGHVAKSGKALVIHSALRDGRFESAMDERMGIKTCSVMFAPLKAKTGGLLGVVQFINKIAAAAVESEPVPGPTEDTVSTAEFTTRDLQFLQVFASQTATTVASNGTFEMLQIQSPHHAQDPYSGGYPDTVLTCFSGGSVPDSKAAKTDDRAGSSIAVEALLERACGGWQFSAFELAEATGNKPLSALAEYLFNQLGFIQEFNLEQSKVLRFFAEVESGYDDTNPYHNRAHAASVMHSMHALLEHGGLLEAAAPALAAAAAPGEAGEGNAPAGAAGRAARLARMACLVAAAHDYEHEGVTNDFLVKTGHERAVRYNDRHVNENHHAAAAFALLLRPEQNFLAHLPHAEFQCFRNLVIELILGTDMADGDRILKAFNDMLNTDLSITTCAGSPGNLPQQQQQQQKQSPAGGAFVDSAAAFAPQTLSEAFLLLQVAMKCADIGHLALDWETHVRWVRLLEEEFFRQGDREAEAGLPVSFLMDRCKPGATATQVGFFDVVVLPLFQALACAAPRAAPALASVEANHRRWRTLAAAAGAA